MRGADLTRANLADAYLADANLRGANLAGANLIDGGQSMHGHRSWCWRDKDGIVYRAGCHEWRNFAAAIDYYGESYNSDCSREEGIARLTLMRDEAIRRGMLSTSGTAI